MAKDYPILTVKQCSDGGSCIMQSKSWDATLCLNIDTCTANCALDGIDYSDTCGILTSSNALTLNFVIYRVNINVESHVYLLDNESIYHFFNIKNKEFTFDIDISNLPCRLNRALGKMRFSTNIAGIAYGLSYCDTQYTNIFNWTDISASSGTGFYGICCNKIDIWKAN
ncbi:concanavalin A-like lectin/glucanase [Guyanagaster necrorhizus]|uniref:Glucanase n=1 Tax=Guyanagaster necrorhizus TaxID=856835 RepID=A0A9P8AQW4_9AGAR|nr:concanavalin A-like lectin/glucanase [Guyanagaster necrorhizus MCA 3950]KAG7443257.1 concanavalin A-like lectin/glucanase [Guyanagaster necrorhizus MCA 3950]